MCRLQAENRTLESARRAESEARTADKAALLDKLACLSAQMESLKVHRLLMRSHVLNTSEDWTQDTEGLPEWTLMCDHKAHAPVHLLQESLEAAETASNEAISTKEALQSKLLQAGTTERDLRSKCGLLEAQATATASQLQEVQQQVTSAILHHAHTAYARHWRCTTLPVLACKRASLSLHHAWASVKMHVLQCAGGQSRRAPPAGNQVLRAAAGVQWQAAERLAGGHRAPQDPAGMC